ncbi:hypothetical protein PAXINDRAFT_9409 [Paxillus involutus ATCC 200175]|nr:hypothetical protein PAXINDRAFT_9409 [Paxillus involutus ATCC 200175]
MVARVQRPAPAFKAVAVVEGMFKDISLADYLGEWVILFFYPILLKNLPGTLPSFVRRRFSRDYDVLNEEEGIAFRGLFIIDPKGIVRQITVNDLPDGRSVDETICLLKAFQYTDKQGEVCPLGWTDGAKTIKPDPKGSMDYFATVGEDIEMQNASSKKRARKN